MIIALASPRLLWGGYAWFVAEFRTAAERLRAGDHKAHFPAGCQRRPALD